MQEFLTRPTLPADWWTAPNHDVLGGRDLLRDEQGTWLGITREGRIAVLTNFREDELKTEARSRGTLVNAFLTQPAGSGQSTENFVKSLVDGEGLKGIGGFSLVCGRIGEHLAVISNRTPSVEGITWIANTKGETVGLSNAAIADRSWTKVTRGEKMMIEEIEKSVAAQDSKESLIKALFGILSSNTLPQISVGKDWESQLKNLRESIFIPAIGGDSPKFESAEEVATARFKEYVHSEKPENHPSESDGRSGVYGTQKQTVVLVTHGGKVTFVERTLYDANGWEITGVERDRSFEFEVRT